MLPHFKNQILKPQKFSYSVEFLNKLKEVSVSKTQILFLEGDFNLWVDTNTNRTMLNGKFIPIHRISSIVVTPYAKGVYSDKFLNEIAKQGTQLIKLDYWGNPVWEFVPKEKTIATLLKAQLLLTTEKYRKLQADLILWLVQQKINSQNLISKDISLSEPTSRALKNFGNWVNDVMIKEGQFAAKYWEQYRLNHNLIVQMEKRKTGLVTGGSNRNATDMVNVLLNLGYGVLAHKIIFELYHEGLEPAVGFYHTPQAKGRRLSLVYDIIEPYRVLIDNIIADNLSLIKETDYIWDIKEHKRFLMLKEQPHVTGQLSESAYKDWVKIFNLRLPKTIAKSTINHYKAVLSEILKREGFGDSEISRSIKTIREPEYKTEEITEEITEGEF